MVRPRIELPDTFTLDWYREQKAQGISNEELADEFYVAPGTIYNWALRLGWKAGDGREGKKLRGPKIDVQRLMHLYNKGTSPRALAEIFNIHVQTVRYHLHAQGHTKLKRRYYKE